MASAPPPVSAAEAAGGDDQVLEQSFIPSIDIAFACEGCLLVLEPKICFSLSSDDSKSCVENRQFKENCC
eukprot:4252396-Amphidinium_carterae.1